MLVVVHSTGALFASLQCDARWRWNPYSRLFCREHQSKTQCLNTYFVVKPSNIKTMEIKHIERSRRTSLILVLSPSIPQKKYVLVCKGKKCMKHIFLLTFYMFLF